MKWTKEIIENITQKLNDESLTRKEIADEYGLTWEQLKAVIRRHKISYSKTQRTGYTYVCKHCGKEFDDKCKLAGHSTTCEKNPKYDENTENLNKGRKLGKAFSTKEAHKLLRCEYCGKEVHGIGCLVRHQMWCEKNPNRTKETFEYIEKSRQQLKEGRNRRKELGVPSWNRGLTAKDSEIIRESTEKKEKIL